MEVNSPLGATYYCDADGNACFQAADLADAGIWTPDDGGLNFIEYDDALGGIRLGKLSPGRGPAPGWVIDAGSDLIVTAGKVGAGEYCDADGANCFDLAAIGGDALGALGCAVDEVPHYDDASWDCAEIHEHDTLAGLSCGDGQIVSWDAGGNAWICSSAGGLPPCGAGEILEHDGTEWQCVSTPSGGSTDWADLTSIPGEIADGDDDTLAGLSCTDGQVASWDDGGSAWVCADQSGGGGGSGGWGPAETKSHILIARWAPKVRNSPYHQ
jgi:hypothetical protein